ncbi:MAG: substrate-binding domain-containing protein [Planctomycetota bacterium]|nr:substrate-binding domain-containing protein [Planctomycetota bacterium]
MRTIRARKGRPPASNAAHRIVAADLRRRMRSGEWPPGTVLPPWRALARHYRVSVRVIQHAAGALKRDGLLALTAQRRLAARDWNSPGTALESRLLVLLTTSPRLSVGNPLLDDLLLGILKGAGERAVPVVFAYDDRLRAHVPAELLEAPLSGVVIQGKIGAQALRGWEKVAVPVVLADHPGAAWKLHASGVDNEGATREAVRRMLDLGHRRLAFVRRVHTHGVHEVEPDSRERQQAFEAALAGVPGAKGEVFSVFANDTSEAAGIAGIFRRGARSTAVLAADEGAGALIVQAARDRGLTVPRDLSIVAFGQARAGDPAFAGPRFDFREIGRMAARLTEAPRTPPRRARHAGTWNDGRTLGPAPVA